MLTITNFSEFPFDKNTAITIGNFDGVHLGHQELIKITKKRAKERNLVPTVITFDIHPNKFFYPDSNHLQIIDLETKLNLFEKYGVELCVVLPFKEIYNLNASEFIERVLIPDLRMKYLVEGSDFKFGKDNNGDINELKQMSKKFGFGLDIVQRHTQSGLEASSTFIRKCISQGEHKLAEKVLGHGIFMKKQEI